MKKWFLAYALQTAVIGMLNKSIKTILLIIISLYLSTAYSAEYGLVSGEVTYIIEQSEVLTLHRKKLLKLQAVEEARSKCNLNNGIEPDVLNLKFEVEESEFSISAIATAEVYCDVSE